MSLYVPSTAREVEVGPFRVIDATVDEVVDRVVGFAVDGVDRAMTVFALHVAGLNSRHDRDFVLSMRQADLVYADGGSVVWLARLAGALTIERAPTTDVGWQILQGITKRLGRPARIALMGGQPGLAERAGRVLEGAGIATVVSVVHGFHEDWAGPLADVRLAAPDVVLVGMGAPREMIWCQTWKDQLPTGLVLTCGGWFGHLTGDEKRAPKLLRRSGLEWIARLAQAPTRLAPRYAAGLTSTAVMTVESLRRRGR
jgi:N-acetylglucosaminyldiphosphoundecaprenol N-acetyl-beta-D-mannosaminyltransferase